MALGTTTKLGTYQNFLGISTFIRLHCRSKVHFERLRDRGLTRIKNLVCSFNRYFSMDVIFAKEIASRSQPLLFGTPSDLDFLAKLQVITLKDHYRRPYNVTKDDFMR